MDDAERKLRDLGERTARDHAYREAPARRIARRARMRRALTIAAPAVAVVLLAGVAIPRVDWPGRERNGSPIATLAAAVDATEAAGTARVEIEYAFWTGAGVISTSATGVTDFDTGRAELQVVYRIGDDERVVQAVTDGKTMYERPAGSPDAKWQESDVPPGAQAGPAASSPAELLRYIESVASGVERIGTDVRDGERMTQYRATLDPAKVAGAAPRGAPEDLVAEYHPTNFWIDEDGLLREVTVGVSTTTDDLSQTVRGTLRFFDFGTPVDIELPRPGEIGDAPATPAPDVTHPPGAVPGTGQYLVTSADGTRRPYVIVTTMNDELRLICVQAIERRPTRAVIVEEETGRGVVTLKKESFDFSGSALKGRIGCTPASMPLAARIVDHPEAFAVRVQHADRPSDEVRLNEAIPVEGTPREYARRDSNPRPSGP